MSEIKAIIVTNDIRATLNYRSVDPLVYLFTIINNN